MIIIAYPATFIVNFLNNYIRQVIPFLLILVSAVLILTERKKLDAIVVFFLTGFLGYSVLNIHQINQPILPLLTGLFGASMLTMSIKTNTQIPRQNISKPKTKLFKPLLGSFIASPLCSFLPGLGSGQAAILGNFISKTDRKGFLVLLGATNTLVMGFSFVALYAISRTRTGAAVAINQILGYFSPNVLSLLIIIVLISGIISFFITKYLAKFFSLKFSKINYEILSYITLGILGIVVLLISRWPGLIILIISTLTGIYCISKGVRRTNMMGCLLIPTILFYLF